MKKRAKPSEPAKASDIPQPWSVGEAVGVGWGGVRAFFLRLAIAHLLPAVGTFGCSILGTYLARVWLTGVPMENPKTTRMLYSIGIAIGLTPIPIALLMGGLCMMRISAARGEKPSLGALVRGVVYAPKMLVYLLLQVLLVLTPTFGIFYLGFVLTPYFMVDRRLGLWAALGASWRATRGHKGGLWLYQLSLAPTRLAAAATFGIANIVVEPLYGTGLAYAYTRLAGQTPLEPFPPEFGRRSLNMLLRATLGVSAVAFAGAVYWVMRLPPVRGSAWTLTDALVRVNAVILGTTTTIALLATLLPWLLDRLEGRTFTMFVAARHVRSQKSGFLTVISILSICGVALSSMALFTVISVMGGFSQDLKRKILGNNAHIVIDTVSQKPFENSAEVLDRVRNLPGVAGATPVVQGEVMMASASNLAGVIVKGVDPRTIGNVIDLPRNIEVGQFDYLDHAERLTQLPSTEVICIGPGGEQYTKGAELSFLNDDLDPVVRAAVNTAPPYRPGIIIGRELGKTLHVCVGDEVTLVSPLGDLGPVGVMPRTKKFRVAGIFYSGMYEYDASHVYTTIDVAQDYFSAPNKISAIDVRVDDGERADQLTPDVTNAVARPDLRVRDWREMNKNLFSALKLERLATFIILSIAIMVASFCIICTLLLMVTEKGKEIAILKAIGASDGAILKTFMTEGMIIGAIGTTFGGATGLALCAGLSSFGLRLNPDIYYIDKLPIQVSGWDFLAVLGAAFLICTLATIYPAYAASRLRPVDGLRYE